MANRQHFHTQSMLAEPEDVRCNVRVILYILVLPEWRKYGIYNEETRRHGCHG